MAIVKSLDTKQPIALTRKAARKRVQRVKLKKEMQNTKRVHKGKGKIDISKIRCYNCSELGHFAWDCPKPCEHANIPQENVEKTKCAKMMDLGDNSVCNECPMICTDIYSDNEDEEIVVYRDQGSSSKNTKKI